MAAGYSLIDDKNNAFLLGDGYTENGQFPFVDQLNLRHLKLKRLYESKLTDKKEDLRDYNV